jgi:citrate lyase beta subunit
MSEMRADLPAWRSLMFVPVTREKFVSTAHQRGADAYILDLEDSVPEAEKPPTLSCASTGRGIRRSRISKPPSAPA